MGSNGKIFRGETETCVFSKAQRETGPMCPLHLCVYVHLSPVTHNIPY